jgi:AraC-like DNA-binding protein
MKEAALTAGFPSANAFTKVFQRRFGTTPTAWRAQQARRKAQGARRKAQEGR